MGEHGYQYSQQHGEKLSGGALERIAHTFLVMSGKGGVGKSTVSVNLAISLARDGLKTGLLDADLHGPSVPKMLGLSSRRMIQLPGQIIPVADLKNLKVVSAGFMVKGNEDAIIMSGPMKVELVRRFLENVAWGELDCLVVDCPPGTGDEQLSLARLLKSASRSAVIVTTPQQMATIDVEKSISFCRRLELPISGIIENMSGFVCPHCHHETDVFSAGGGRQLAHRFGAPFLGSIPLDPEVVKSGDAEEPHLTRYNGTNSSLCIDSIVDLLKAQLSFVSAAARRPGLSAESRATSDPAPFVACRG